MWLTLTIIFLVSFPNEEHIKWLKTDISVHETYNNGSNGYWEYYTSDANNDLVAENEYIIFAEYVFHGYVSIKIRLMYRFYQ